MAKRTVADQFVEIIQAAGVQRMYGVVGDSLNPVVDAIRRHDGIDWVMCGMRRPARSPPAPRRS